MMKHFYFLIIMLSVAVFSCEDDEMPVIANCSTPSSINIIDFNESTSQVDVGWTPGANVDNYVLEHYIDSVFIKDYVTSQLNQLVTIDLSTPAQHKFSVLSRCCNQDFRGVNIYLNIAGTESPDCAPPTNVNYTLLEDSIIISWEGPANAANYIVYDYSTEPPTSYDAFQNSIQIPTDTALTNTDYGIVTICDDGSSSIETSFCVVTYVDIDKALECDIDFYCNLATYATTVHVFRSRGNRRYLIFRGSPQSCWNQFCRNNGPYSCM